MAVIHNQDLEQHPPPRVASLLQIDDPAFDLGAVIHEPGQVDIIGAWRIANHGPAPLNTDGLGIVWVIGFADQLQAVAHLHERKQRPASVILEACQG